MWTEVGRKWTETGAVQKWTETVLYWSTTDPLPIHFVRPVRNLAPPPLHKTSSPSGMALRKELGMLREAQQSPINRSS